MNLSQAQFRALVSGVEGQGDAFEVGASSTAEDVRDFSARVNAADASVQPQAELASKHPIEFASWNVFVSEWRTWVLQFQFATDAQALTSQQQQEFEGFQARFDAIIAALENAGFKISSGSLKKWLVLAAIVGVGGYLLFRGRHGFEESYLNMKYPNWKSERGGRFYDREDNLIAPWS